MPKFSDRGEGNPSGAIAPQESPSPPVAPRLESGAKQECDASFWVAYYRKIQVVRAESLTVIR